MTCRSTIDINESHDGGFSLIEMLVVLTVLALASLLVLPSFEKTAEKTPQQLSRALQAMTLQARTNAISNGTTEQILIEPASRRITYNRAEFIEIPASYDLKIRVGRELVNADAVVALLLFPDGGSTGLHITFEGTRQNMAGVNVSWLTGLPSRIGEP